MRFFFDYVSDGQVLLDYKGEDFRAPEPAIDYGEAIVERLKCALTEKWQGWSIAIRDIEGNTVHRISIDGPQLRAA